MTGAMTAGRPAVSVVTPVRTPPRRSPPPSPRSGRRASPTGRCSSSTTARPTAAGRSAEALAAAGAAAPAARLGRAPRRRGGAQRRHPRRPRPLPRLPRRRRPLAAGKARAQLAFVEQTGCPLVFSAYRRIDAAGRPLGVVRPPARVTHSDAAARQLHRLPDRALRHRGARPGRDAAVRPPPGLRPLADAAEAHPRGARASPRCSPTTGCGRARLSSNRLAAARATWAILREHERLPLPKAGYYFLHYAAGALAKRARDRDRAPRRPEPRRATARSRDLSRRRLYTQG